MRLPSILFMALAIGVLTGFRLWSLGFSMTWTAAGYMTISSVVTWLIAFNTYFLALRLGSVGVVAPIIEHRSRSSRPSSQWPSWARR